MKFDRVQGLMNKGRVKLGIKEPTIWSFWEKEKSTTDIINGVYYVYFGTKAVESTVKHELFHVYRDNPKSFDQAKSNKFILRVWFKIKYHFCYEIRAKLYTVCDIKL